MTPFTGTYTALVTPFYQGAVDYESLKNLIEYQITQGITGLVPLGTTGETPTLLEEEQEKILKTVLEVTASRVPIISGATSNSTAKAAQLTKKYDAYPLTAFMHVTPYYNKPTQTGLLEHYSQIAQQTQKPIVLYNNPGRCGIEIALNTIESLHKKYPHINTLKACSYHPNQIATMVDTLGSGFTILSGDDNTAVPFISVGTLGLISTLSNAAPKAVSTMIDYALKNDFHTAGKAHRTMARLFDAIFMETSPAPIKYLLKKLGIIRSSEVRLPLVPASESAQKHLDTFLPFLKQI